MVQRLAGVLLGLLADVALQGNTEPVPLRLELPARRVAGVRRRGRHALLGLAAEEELGLDALRLELRLRRGDVIGQGEEPVRLVRVGRRQLEHDLLDLVRRHEGGAVLRRGGGDAVARLFLLLGELGQRRSPLAVQRGEAAVLRLFAADLVLRFKLVLRRSLGALGGGQLLLRLLDGDTLLVGVLRQDLVRRVVLGAAGDVGSLRVQVDVAAHLAHVRRLDALQPARLRGGLVGCGVLGGGG
jgi:hypothetical protein